MMLDTRADNRIKIKLERLQNPFKVPEVSTYVIRIKSWRIFAKQICGGINYNIHFLQEGKFFCYNYFQIFFQN